MLRVLVLTSFLLCLSAVAVAEEGSECPSPQPSDLTESETHCGQADVPGDHDNEALSLIQVGAKRLAAAKSSATASTAADASTAAAITGDATLGRQPTSATALVELAAVAKGHASTAARRAQMLVQAQAQSSYTLAIVIVAMVGLVALALLAVALQPGHVARDNFGQASISQNFPRATQSTPYGRQGGPGSAYYPAPDSYKVPGVPGYAPYAQPGQDARPSYRDSFMPPNRSYPPGQTLSPADSLQGSMAALPKRSLGAEQHSRSLPLPRVSTPGAASSARPSLPRVQGATAWAGSRPGTGLSLTPHQSLAPMKQQQEPGEDNTDSVSVPPGPDVHRPPEVTGFAPRRPPALCPMLVLPHCESFFAIPIDELVTGTNTVEILGLSGNALLRSTVKDTEEGRVIEVSMSPPRSPPLASISAPATFGPRTGLRELKGSRGKHYGWLRPTPNGYVLRCGDDDVMTVITNSGSGQLHLYAAGNGDMLSQASRSADGEGIFAPEDLEVRVTPGMDAVLALLCVVSAALFGDGSTPFSFSRA